MSYSSAPSNTGVAMLNPNTLSYYTRKAQERGQIFTLEKSMSKIYNLIED